MLKSYGWVVGGGVVAHVIIVSAPVQRIGILGFSDFSRRRVRTWDLLGLDNCNQMKQLYLTGKLIGSFRTHET